MIKQAVEPHAQLVSHDDVEGASLVDGAGRGRWSGFARRRCCAWGEREGGTGAMVGPKHKLAVTKETLFVLCMYGP